MAVLNKLRNSTWVLIVVLVSLGLFVASDYFSSSNRYSMGDSQSVGEIGGEDVSILDFDAKYKGLLGRMLANGSEENDETREQASMYAWNQFIQEMIFDKEYEKVGVDITEAEAAKLLYSDDAHPTIKQNFSNNGVFSPANVTNFVKNMAKKDPKMMAEFENIVSQIVIEVRYRKYNSLVSKSLYATSLDAEDDILSTQANISGKSITLNYATIDDKTIKVTDEDLKEYISKHKEDFKQKASRDLQYVLVDITPTKSDTMALYEELKNEIPAFNSTDNDSLFVTINNSLTPFDTNFQSHGSYDKEIEGKLFSATKDSAFGPVYYNGGYSIFKVIDAKKDSNFYFHAIKAEVSIPGVTKQDTLDAYEKAKRLLAESASSANPLDFFNSKSNTGEIIYAQDLGWLREGSQTPEVNKVIPSLGAGQGSVVKSQFGISIVKLLEPKSYDLIKVAELRKVVEPLKETEENAYQKASQFRSSLTTGKDGEFEAMTKKAGVVKSVANNIKESDKTMTGIPGTRDVVRWAYGFDREEGDYSDVIICDNFLIVAQLVKIKEEGVSEVDDVREKVTRLVLNEKKAVILKGQLEAAMKTGKTMEEIAINAKTIVQPFNNINFNSTSVPFAGNDVKLVGFICGLKPNKMSRPIISNDGVHLILVENASYPQIPADLTVNKANMFTQKKQQVYNLVTEALKKVFDVKDDRAKYY